MMLKGASGEKVSPPRGQTLQIIHCRQHREALSLAGVLLVGVVEASVALGRQSADLLPVGDQLILLQVDLGGVLGVRLLQTVHVSAQRVDLSHRQRRRVECETSGGSRMKVQEGLCPDRKQ